MNERNLSEDLKIDKYALDVMAERMPEFIQYWGEVRAKAEKAKDAAYATYKFLKNDKGLFYRKNPPEGLKVTETVIDNLVETDAEVQLALASFQDLQGEYTIADVAFTAIRDKSSRVRDEISLWLGGYFADSRQAVSKKMTQDRLED